MQSTTATLVSERRDRAVRFPWDSQQVALLRRRWANRDRVADIARELGCDAETVRHKAGSLGLTRRVGEDATVQATSWAPEKVERLRELREKGRTFSQIAADLGVTRNAVIGKALRLGLSQTGSRRGGAATVARMRARASVLEPPRPAASRRNPISKAALAKPISAPTEIVCEPAPEGGIGIQDLEQHHCSWIIAGEREHARYCGAPRQWGSVYKFCEAHLQAAVNPQSKVGRRSP